VPGIGAVYNRQYVKAVLHFSIFAGLIIVAEHGPGVFPVAVFAFYIFTIIDAYRSAQNLLRKLVMHPHMVEEEEEGVNVPIWGGVLVLLGVIFFLNNLEVFSLRDMARFLWPFFFVGLGLYLVGDYFFSSKKKRSSTPPPPPASQNSVSAAVEENR
jgi:hypothetical protein